ncbi:MAG TPA: RodZ domain-containing protein [Sphingomicrobium sp.]|nr:RodZ domain-containing protein [Sphingomicrobium sp.]
MDETEESEVISVGERLRTAREKKGLTLEEVASQTRIPRRHLESVEASDWERLPAPTYTIGFAKSYAAAVGLDRTEIGEQLRGEMGGQRPSTVATESFEPADPARTMPKWLVLGAILAVLLVVLLFSWLSQRELQPAADPEADRPGLTAETAPPPVPPAPAAPAQGPVVITASEEAWIQVRDGGATLREGILGPGQSFEVPASASAPVLTTGKPEALRISVGTADAPPVGPAATTVRNVSLRPADLMQRREGATPTPPAPSAPPMVQNTAG